MQHGQANLSGPASSPLSLEGFAWVEIPVTSISRHHSRAPLRLGLRLEKGSRGEGKGPSHVAREGLQDGAQTGFGHHFAEEAPPDCPVGYGALETL